MRYGTFAGRSKTSGSVVRFGSMFRTDNMDQTAQTLC